MKNIKFKVLIMFMLLVLVGLGSSSVFAKTVDVLKTSDLYKLKSENNDTVVTITSNDMVESDQGIGNVSSHFYIQSMILDKTFVINSVEYIRYSDWIDGYFNNSYGRQDIWTYNNVDLYYKFGEAYYNYMSKMTYMAPGYTVYTFEEVIQQVDEELYKKISRVSTAEEKGYFIIQDFFKDNTEYEIREFIGKGSGMSAQFCQYLYNAYVHPSNINSIYYEQDDRTIYERDARQQFSNEWGKTGIEHNIDLKNKYLDYYKSKKTSIDESLIPSIPSGSKPVAPEKNPQDYEEGINNFWENAFDWFKGAQSSGGMGTVTDGFMKGATNIIKMIGNMIFIVVTSILGVKYIWGSADAKYSVKNSLFSLVIAAVMFYGWDSISNIIQTVTNSTVGNNIESTAKTIYTYILYFVNIAAIGGIIFLGVKYLLASAEGKSQLKMNMGPAFLGIIMVYATISFLNTILSIFLG